jgi:hypothetical protein
MGGSGLVGKGKTWFGCGGCYALVICFRFQLLGFTADSYYIYTVPYRMGLVYHCF